MINTKSFSRRKAYIHSRSKRRKILTLVLKTQHRKTKIDQKGLHQEGYAVPASLAPSVVIAIGT